MLFEWDEAKSRRTLNERGFGFEYAARIFLGPTLERDKTIVATMARSESRRSVGLGTIFSSSSTPIAVMPVTSSRRRWLTGRSVDYGNHSPNNGKYPPNEAAYQSSQN